MLPAEPEPKNIALCETAPPTVETPPESGPNEGGRKPVPRNASFRADQVQPASTTAWRFAMSIPATADNRVMSNRTQPSADGAYPPV